jgi:Holliday junction resolvase RusA-like endonuclease
MTGALRMTIEAFLSVPASDSAKKRAAKLSGEIRPTKKPDFDNIAKAIADGCNGVAFPDDAQIVSAIIKKHYGETPCVRVTIQPQRSD